ALHIDLGDVLEQPAPPADQQQQPTPRVVVVLVHLQVLGQIGDPLGQQRDLGLRGAGVGVMQAVLAQNVLFLFGGERHGITLYPSVRDKSGAFSKKADVAAANCSTRRGRQAVYLI